MIVFTSLNFSVKSKICNTLVSDILRHLPCLFKTIKWRINVCVKDRTAIAIVVKHRLNSHAFLERCLNSKRNKLIPIKRKIINLCLWIEEFIFLHEFCSCTFTGNLFCVNLIITFIFLDEIIRCCSHCFKNLLAKFRCFFCIKSIAKFIYCYITKLLHCFVNANEADCIVKMFEVNQTIREIRKDTFFNVPCDDVSYGIQRA